MSAYYPRIADQLLENALSAMGAVVIEGPRACGKTVTARQRATSEVLLDVDFDLAQVAAIDPKLILDGPTPRLIDEWQREPRIWDVVRREVDNRNQAGQFILTGSATPADDVARHPGAGRMAILQMRPMSFFEQTISPGSISLQKLLNGEQPQPARSEFKFEEYVERLVVGGWPSLLNASVDDAMQFVQSYIDNLVEHDVAIVSGAKRNPRLIRRFLRAYAQVTAHPIALKKILDRAVGSEEENEYQPSRWSAEPYLEALRRMMVVDEIEAWNPELRSRSRLINLPKRHLVDPSLAVSLMECDQQRLLKDLNTLGYLFESMVARDLRVYATANRASVFHYRERAGNLEVDLIVERTDGAWIGVEIKLGGSQIDQAASALRRLAETRVLRRPEALIVVTATPISYKRDDGVWVVPLALLGP